MSRIHGPLERVIPPAHPGPPGSVPRSARSSARSCRRLKLATPMHSRSHSTTAPSFSCRYATPTIVRRKQFTRLGSAGTRCSSFRVTYHRDRKRPDRSRTMRIDAVEFLRRFLLHVLPSGFPKVCHDGVLANRSKKLDRCRELLADWNRDAGHDPDPPTPSSEKTSEESLSRCKACGSPTLVRREIAPRRGICDPELARIDSS